MTSRERLMATLRGGATDRPAVNFYEIGGFDARPDDPDPFNVHSDPSWRPLLELAERETDLIRMRWPRAVRPADHPAEEFFRTEAWLDGGRRFTRTTLTLAGRTLTRLTRRDPDLHTTWTLEHLLKGPEDLAAYLELPDEALDPGTPDVSALLEAEREVGERGIVMVDVGDPLCSAAELFSMAEFTVVALTEPKQFHRLLAKFAAPRLRWVEAASRAFAGRLWRICGPEYATEPYLPPRLFGEYVVPYTGPLVRAIRAHGGFARIHCHGRIRSALEHILAMGPDALDPAEPPPLGDVELPDLRREVGERVVVFGNIEIRDIEQAEPAEFERIVARALRDGPTADGRGFVLMPTACPCGRTITPRALANYRTMVRLATGRAASREYSPGPVRW